jgi:hypothetical protein
MRQKIALASSASIAPFGRTALEGGGTIGLDEANAFPQIRT